MIVGILKEIKAYEFRVALTPDGVRQVTHSGHEVLVEKGAGSGAGFQDRDYRNVGARIADRSGVFKRSELILKVKEPQPSEYRLLRPGLLLFTFLHLAANRPLLRELLKRKVTAIAYETVQTEDGRLPLLAPMSEIAGLLTPLIGANYLRKDMGGKGTLLPSVGQGGTGHVTVIGAGHVGSNAIKIAHGLGASVTAFDIKREKLEQLSKEYSERLQILWDPKDLPEILKRTDLLVGAVLVPGKRAPIAVTKKMIQLLETGSVVIDVAVDQGGCVETIRPTTLKNPVYKQYGVIHYGVTNIPSLVPHTATESLSQVTLPYILKIADQGLDRAVVSDLALRKGLNVRNGEIILDSVRTGS